MTSTKLRQYISKARKNFTALAEASEPSPEVSATVQADLAKIRRRLDFIFEGSLTQAELAAQTQADITRILAHKERAAAPKSRRQIRTGGPLTVRDANTLIQSRDIEDAEKNRRQWAQNAKKQRLETMKNDEIKAAENQRREAALIWETGLDGQPLYCVDKYGKKL